jgi:geranylgeranyl diphosphate synthase, type I
LSEALTQRQIDAVRRYLAGVKRSVLARVDRPKYRKRFGPPETLDHHYLYLRADSKAIRPALLLTACEAAGGDPRRALPAACAVEVFHTWSLVHDDILDRDDLRRGRPTVHAFARDRFEGLAPMNAAEREHLGAGIAIMVGDNLLAFSFALLNELGENGAVSPAVATRLVADLATSAANGLIEGEMLDCLFEKRPLESLTAADALGMLAKKTGCLLEFCMEAGVMLGLDSADPRAPLVREARSFARHCGLAFQLRDDLLGLIGRPEETSKPVGSDIREGKRTPTVLFAYEAANEQQRKEMLRHLGNPRIAPKQVAAFVDLLESLGAIDRTRRLAEKEIAAALRSLSAFPP